MDRITLLADALYYTCADSGASIEKAQGVVIGIVSVLMGQNNLGFFDAIEIVKEHMPETYRIEAIPESWQDAF